MCVSRTRTLLVLDILVVHVNVHVTFHVSVKLRRIKLEGKGKVSGVGAWWNVCVEMEWE